MLDYIQYKAGFGHLTTQCTLQVAASRKSCLRLHFKFSGVGDVFAHCQYRALCLVTGEGVPGPTDTVGGQARRSVGVVSRRRPTSRPICNTGIPEIMDDDELFRAEISRHHGPLTRRPSVLDRLRLPQWLVGGLGRSLSFEAGRAGPAALNSVASIRRRLTWSRSRIRLNARLLVCSA